MAIEIAYTSFVHPIKQNFIEKAILFENGFFYF